MFSCIYIEESIVENPVVRDIVARFPNIPQVKIQRYGEVFNRKAQNFRLQKLKPALILANKHDKWVLPAPAGYGFGTGESYYFSHMLNCVYDCRYCFLQGMYRSAHYVLFVNYSDFMRDCETKLAGSGNKYFYSGYDCDSLALEPLSGFATTFIEWFRDKPDCWFELRTKSTQIRGILQLEPAANCVLAYSFTPEDIAQELEHKVPSVQKRIDALKKLQDKGWTVALRFEPVIYQQGLKQKYQVLLKKLFDTIDPDRIHSVSVGMFRIPRDYFNNMRRLYPDDKLLALQYSEVNGLVSYEPHLEQQMVADLKEAISAYIRDDRFYHCTMGESSGGEKR